MAADRPGRASVRVRTTAAAVLVVAAALLTGAVALVLLVRGSVRDGLRTGAEQRVAALAAQLEGGGLPAAGAGDADDDEDEPGDQVWQVLDAGTVVRSSGGLREPLTGAGRPSGAEQRGGEVRLRGADHPYVVVSDTVRAGHRRYTVVAAASLEDVDDTTAALVTPLAAGLPLLLLVVGGTTWAVVTRSLAPVERIRREVEEITGDRLDRRVPEPATRDEVHRLAQTMNRMLARLDAARDRQRQFVADASHELRSPLAGIRQAAEVARAHPDALPDGELADAVLAESARLERLVGQLLLLTRADAGGAAGERRDVDLDDLALAEAQRVGRAGLTAVTTGIGAGRVLGDAAALAQVVRNLTDNAVRHADRRVAFTVRASGDASGGARIALVVEDDGAGIPAGQRERVFERFVRLDEARDRDAGGSGLGLAIVREIVTAHGGTVTAESSALGGARFEVLLPAA